MMRIVAFLRSWMVPALFVGLAVLLTVPWTFWIVLAAYQRDVKINAQNLAQRMHAHQQVAGWLPQMLKPVIQGDLLGDPAVQGVCLFDYSRSVRGRLGRPNVPLPASVDEAERMVDADPNSYRQVFKWESEAIYIDLSRKELWNQFWVSEGPLLWKVGSQTTVAIIILSIAGVVAYRLWGSAAHQRLRAELEQQGLLAERGLTAAVMAHEIRNPLAALRFQLHSLRRNVDDPARVSATADTIDSELQRIQQLVQDYLAHEKAQAMRVVPVELADAVRKLQTLMAELLRDGGTRMVVAEGARAVVVNCDPHALRQVLMNLVLNAQQAMGHGGTITITIGQEDGLGTISVADTGPGIPPEMRERLFKPFATSKKEGSGIGLALVKRFVDNFGGSIAVDSEAGKGTTFHLRLPLAGALDPSDPANQEAAQGEDYLAHAKT